MGTLSIRDLLKRVRSIFSYTPQLLPIKRVLDGSAGLGSFCLETMFREKTVVSSALKFQHDQKIGYGCTVLGKYLARYLHVHIRTSGT